MASFRVCNHSSGRRPKLMPSTTAIPSQLPIKSTPPSKACHLTRPPVNSIHSFSSRLSFVEHHILGESRRAFANEIT